MSTEADIAWLAGLLEGEASFGYYRGCATLQLQMTDEDIVERVIAMTGAVRGSPWKPKGKDAYKMVFGCRLLGANAVRWMERILPYMGERRTAKIYEIIGQWQTSTYAPRAPKGTPRPMAPCHPSRTLCAKGMCKPCYQSNYHAARRRIRVAGPSTLYAAVA